jgi:voltage-gated potassium channel
VHQVEWLMLVLSLAIIPVALVEESSAPRWLERLAAVANWTIWISFAAEIVVVLIVAPRRRAARRAHWLEAVIVVVTPPFLPHLLSLFRGARLLRLLRLARLGLLGTRAVRAERVLTTRHGFRHIALLTGLLVALAGAVISVADAADFPNIGRGMWWAITTVTTVGYGDVVPHTVAGRLVASALMLLGIGFISILTATIASSFVAHDLDPDQPTLEYVMAALRRIDQRLDAIEAHGHGRVPD